MLQQRLSRPTRSWRTCVGWLIIAGLYLIAAVLGVFLAEAVAQWWPLLLSAASVLAAVLCTRLGRQHVPARPKLELVIPAQRGPAQAGLTLLHGRTEIGLDPARAGANDR